MLETQVDQAIANGYPNMNRRFAINQAKKDYLATPNQSRAKFTIFEQDPS